MRLPLAVLALVTLSSVLSAQAAVTPGSILYVEDTEFGQAVSAALLKKKVPVQVTTIKDKAAFYLEESSNATKEGTGERVAKVLAFGAFAGSGKTFEASVRLTNGDGVVLFAHNAKKSDIRSAAEDVANKLKDYVKKQK